MSLRSGKKFISTCCLYKKVFNFHIEVVHTELNPIQIPMHQVSYEDLVFISLRNASDREALHNRHIESHSRRHLLTSHFSTYLSR
eukprot:UN18262